MYSFFFFPFFNILLNHNHILKKKISAWVKAACKITRFSLGKKAAAEGWKTRSSPALFFGGTHASCPHRNFFF